MRERERERGQKLCGFAKEHVYQRAASQALPPGCRLLPAALGTTASAPLPPPNTTRAHEPTLPTKTPPPPLDP
jgi:hypothetical protein